MSNDEIDKLKLNNKEFDKKKTPEKKRRELVFRSWLIHHLQNISHQKVYTFWYCLVNDEEPSTSFQIIEQIEVIQGVVLTGISKTNDSALGKKPKFSPKETLVNGKWFWYCLLNLLSHQLMHRVIEQYSSILQDFFSFVLKFFVTLWRKNSLEKIKKNEYCSMIMLFENSALWYALFYKFHMWLCVLI